MTKGKWMMVALAAMLVLGLAAGCSDSDSDSGGGSATSYAGTWTGLSCGREMTMVINQNGTALSGSFTFTDPVFSGTFSGTVSSATPPAAARLNVAGRNWWFDLDFSSFNQFSGGFYKEESGGLVCNVSARR